MFVIHDYMLEDLSLKNTDLVLFAYITTQGVCEDSLTTLMKKVGVNSVNTIRNSLKSLEDKGLITITTRGNKPSVIEVTYSTTKEEVLNTDKINPKEILRRGVLSRRSVLD